MFASVERRWYRVRCMVMEELLLHVLSAGGSNPVDTGAVAQFDKRFSTAICRTLYFQNLVKLQSTNDVI